jgi:hypothetical protein
MLDVTTQNILGAIESRQDVFMAAVQTQATLIRTQITDEHGMTRAEITREFEVRCHFNKLTCYAHLFSSSLSGKRILQSRNGAWPNYMSMMPLATPNSGNMNFDACPKPDLLQQIITWSENPNGACIFWLNGMAGTGKSTIARTLLPIRNDLEQVSSFLEVSEILTMPAISLPPSPHSYHILYPP